MFQFTGFPSIRYGLAYGWLEFFQPGFPIQISADRWIFAPPRSFSQLITSFVGSWCQGILPTLLLAWSFWSGFLSSFWVLPCLLHSSEVTTFVGTSQSLRSKLFLTHFWVVPKLNFSRFHDSRHGSERSRRNVSIADVLFFLEFFWTLNLRLNSLPFESFDSHVLNCSWSMCNFQGSDDFSEAEVGQMFTSWIFAFSSSEVSGFHWKPNSITS